MGGEGEGGGGGNMVFLVSGHEVSICLLSWNFPFTLHWY